MLEPDLRFVYDAVPKVANAPLLSAQINALAKQHNVTIASYRIAEVQITSAKQQKKQTRSFVFNLQATGNYNSMIDFSSSLASLSRIVTVESMSIARDSRTNDLILFRGAAGQPPMAAARPDTHTSRMPSVRPLSVRTPKPVCA